MWKDHYQFEPHWFKTPFNHKMHYVDVGKGFPVVMLHGNPTWSFMYRDLLRELSEHNLRAIAPDHIGCGLSDKPQDWTYTLEKHTSNFTAFIEDELSLNQFDLVVSDWGAPIGFLFATRYPQKIRRIVVLNSTIWMSRNIPKAIYLTRWPFIGALLVRRLNLLLKKAIRSCTVKRMSSDFRRGYRAPYQTYEERIAIQRFPQDIPLSPRHPSYASFQYIAEHTDCLQDKPMLICWGKQDFCFPSSFLHEWQEKFPHAQVNTYPQAGHFILEDALEAITAIREFLAQN